MKVVSDQCMSDHSKDPGRVEDPALRGGPGFGLPLEGGCLYYYLFEGVLECWSSGVLKKQ